MNDQDKNEFKALMVETCAEYGKESGPLLKPYWRKLSPIMDLDTMRGAIDAHTLDADRGRFFPKVADIIHQIEKASPGDNRPDADEAWSIAYASFDESDSVCINAEILEARSVAMPIFNSGDEVGARMAFKSAYTRIVDQAKRTNQPAGWFLSIGFDPSRREQARLDGEAAGRLPKPPDGPRLLLDGTYSDEVDADDDWPGKRLGNDQSSPMKHIAALIEK